MSTRTPGERDHVIATLQRDGEVRNAEFQLRRRDGTLITVLESARAVRDEHGEIIGYEGTISDISERKRAETAVFEEKEKAQVTLQSIGDAVITTDADGRIEYLNPVAEELTGWESREARRPAAREVFKASRRTTREPLEARSRAACAKAASSTVADHDGAGQPPRPGNRDPGFRRADPRSQRPASSAPSWCSTT